LGGYARAKFEAEVSFKRYPFGKTNKLLYANGMSKFLSRLSVRHVGLVLGVAVIVACGGSGSEIDTSAALSKPIETHFNNNSTTDVQIGVNARTPQVLGAGHTSVASYVVTLPQKTDTEVWSVFVRRQSDSHQLATGSFTWNFTNASASSKLDINYDAMTGLTFNTEAKR